MCTDSQLARELRAYIYWIEPLWRVLKVPLEQTCPLFENHCFRLRNKLKSVRGSSPFGQ